jgi:cytochrome c oxidase subunit I
VAFPALNLSSFYLWVGGDFLSYSHAVHRLDTGWTFYTPYSTTTQGPVVAATMGVFVLGFSSIFTGLNFIVTINTMRPPGMTWFKMPLFLWATYATSIIQVLATPVLGITVLLLAAERVFKIGIFDPALQRRPGNLSALFLVLLAPRGVHHDSARDGDHLRADECAQSQGDFRLSLHRLQLDRHCPVRVLGVGTPHVHQWYGDVTTIIFSALTFTVSIPSAIKVFNWLATMYKGRYS